MKKIMIIGATSAIAEATARIYAREGARFYLLARNGERLEAIARDLQIRGAAQVDFAVLDVNALETHGQVVDGALESLEGIDLALIGHGTLPDQQASERDPALALQEFTTNALSTISLLTHLANRMEKQGHGTIAVITSVAAERGRRSNYVYGSAKAAVSVFLQGLRNRLHSSGVQVLDIKPGFVDTPMTAEFTKGFLWAQPGDVARVIHRAVSKGKTTVFAPCYWRWIMLAIKAIPEFVFKRMNL